MLGEAGGTGGRERRAEQVAYTEAPIRQGRLDNPWEGLVGGVVSGEARDAEGLIRKAAKDPEKARWVVEVVGKMPGVKHGSLARDPFGRMTRRGASRRWVVVGRLRATDEEPVKPARVVELIPGDRDRGTEKGPESIRCSPGVGSTGGVQDAASVRGGTGITGSRGRTGPGWRRR